MSAGAINIAWDIVQDVRGSVGMYMFILEEATQTLGMALYMLYKSQQWAQLISTAEGAIQSVIDPAIAFTSQWGQAAYPLNLAYATFFQSAKTTFQTYIQVARANL